MRIKSRYISQDATVSFVPDGIHIVFPDLFSRFIVESIPNIFNFSCISSKIFLVGEQIFPFKYFGTPLTLHTKIEPSPSKYPLIKCGIKSIERLEGIDNSE